jgi:23S rRNA (guanosine2251-2'-O)-methyltransferase
MDNILIGRNPVIEALKAGRPLEKIFILYGVHGGGVGRIRQLAKQNGVPCVEVGKQKFRELVGDATSQGVAAVVGVKQYVDVDDILKVATDRGEPSFVLVLDEIEDPQNLGALLRTAECTGVHGVIIPKHHAATVSAAVGKASAGASEYIPVAKVTNIASTIDELKAKGIWVVGASVDGNKLYSEVDYSMPIALVIGSEGKGIRKLVKVKCDFLVKIPLLGKIESLNASVAGALLMYEVVRKRGKM